MHLRLGLFSILPHASVPVRTLPGCAGDGKAAPYTEEVNVEQHRKRKERCAVLLFRLGLGARIKPCNMKHSFSFPHGVTIPSLGAGRVRCSSCVTLTDCLGHAGPHRGGLRLSAHRARPVLCASAARQLAGALQSSIVHSVSYCHRAHSQFCTSPCIEEDCSLVGGPLSIASAEVRMHLSTCQS